MAQFRAASFAETTKRTYSTHRDSYLRFCLYMEYSPVPASPTTICRYIAFLSRSLKFKSIKQYLNIVGVIHKELGYPNPLLNNWLIVSTLRGVRRVLGDTVHQKLPITPDILLRVHNCLDFKSSLDASFWAACLIGFFCFLRKSNLFRHSTGIAHVHTPFLRRSDIEILKWGLLVNIHHSKTIQYREKKMVQFPVPGIPGSPLCPLAAVVQAFLLTVHSSPNSPAFMFHNSQGQLQPLTYKMFLDKLRVCLRQIGFNPQDFAGHSLRRGGASFAFQSGVPVDLIKLQGDWSSDAYLQYLTVPLQTRLYTATLISNKLRDSSRA